MKKIFPENTEEIFLHEENTRYLYRYLLFCKCNFIYLLTACAICRNKEKSSGPTQSIPSSSLAMRCCHASSWPRLRGEEWLWKRVDSRNEKRSCQLLLRCDTRASVFPVQWCYFYWCYYNCYFFIILELSSDISADTYLRASHKQDGSTFCLPKTKWN